MTSRESPARALQMPPCTKGTCLTLLNGERWEVRTFSILGKRPRLFMPPPQKLDSLFISLKASLTDSLVHDDPLSASVRLLEGECAAGSSELRVLLHP
eukprot:698686-Pyramimonas_sp.AAC.1